MPINRYGLEYAPFEDFIIPGSQASYSELAGVPFQDWWRMNYGDLANEMELPPYWLEKYMQPGTFDYLSKLAQGTAVYQDRPEGVDVTLGQVLDHVIGLPSGEHPPLPTVEDTEQEGWYAEQETPDAWGLPVYERGPGYIPLGAGIGAGADPLNLLGVNDMPNEAWMYSDVDYDIGGAGSGGGGLGGWWNEAVVNPWNQFVGRGGQVALPPNTQYGMAPAIGMGNPAAMIPAAKTAALAVSVPRTVGTTMRAGIGASSLVALIVRFGKPVMTAIMGALAVKEALDVVAGGGSNDIMITWNPFKKAVIKKRRRYSFTAYSSPGTIAKSAKALKKVLRKHDKALKSFLPKKTTYGQVPSRLLSAAEKKLIRSK